MRYDIISPRENRDGKTHWQKIGAGFIRDKGGFSLLFDALPLPDRDGRVSLLMVEHTERDERPSTQRSENDRGGGGGVAEDTIPFAAETRV